MRAATYDDLAGSDADHPAHDLVGTMRWKFIDYSAGRDRGTLWILTKYPTETLKSKLAGFDTEYIEFVPPMQECLDRLCKDNRPDAAAIESIIKTLYGTNKPERSEARMATPNDKTKFKNQAQARAITVLASIPEAAARRIPSDHYVEGYAARYEPYVLYDTPDGPVYERFERGCFDGCDMSDIIMQYDHAGKVMARNTNGSLIVEVDDTGLFIAADLGRTEAARSLYEDIETGMVTKMSWRFALGDYYYDEASRTIVHRTVKKIYDVSAVSIPANENTEISARAWADGEIARAARREAELDERRRKLRLKISNILGGI